MNIYIIIKTDTHIIFNIFMNKFLLLLGVILVLSYGSGTTLYLDEEVTLDVAKGKFNMLTNQRIKFKRS